MANCCICGKKMGLFEAAPLSLMDKDLSSYETCGSCGQKLKLIKEGEVSAYVELQPVINGLIDERLRQYLNSISKNSEQSLKELEEKRKEEKKYLELRARMEEDAKSIILTTGYSFEGYKITEYKNIISGEVVLGTGFLSEFSASFSDLFGTNSNQFSEKLKTAKNYAIKNLKNACLMENGNAIIGVDFDYITFNNNMIGVVANGTAVRIERNL